MDQQIITWDEASEILETFCVFSGNPEMRWFEKAWGGFIKEGKASYSNDIEKHWVLARIVTLDVMFMEFCEKAWDEKSDAESIITEIQWEEDRFNLVRLGNMVEKDDLSEDGSQTELCVEAIQCLVYKCRAPVYNTLEKVFENGAMIFVSLWLCLDDDIEVGKYSDDLIDETLNHDMTDNKMEAFDYVCNGMFGLDA